MILNGKNNNISNWCKSDIKIITNTEDDVNYIKYTLSGSYSGVEILKLPEEIYEICQKKNIWRVLLDTKSLNELNINGMNQIYSGEIIAKVLKDQVSLAVYGDGEIFTDFTETVAVNRGVRIKISNKWSDLKSWLMEK